MCDGPDLLLLEGCLGNLVSVWKWEGTTFIYIHMLFFVPHRDITGGTGLFGFGSSILDGD